MAQEPSFENRRETLAQPENAAEAARRQPGTPAASPLHDEALAQPDVAEEAAEALLARTPQDSPLRDEALAQPEVAEEAAEELLRQQDAGA